MRNQTLNPAQPSSWRRGLIAVVIVATAAGLSACGSRADAGGGVSAAGVPYAAWSAPAADGGYTCLRDTGGAGGQCNIAMGLGWGQPFGAAADGGYACLRDTGGAGGQCNALMGLRPVPSAQLLTVRH
jgi:hypothetical protein